MHKDTKKTTTANKKKAQGDMEDGLTGSCHACKRHRKELIKSLSKRSGSRNRKKRKAVKDTLKINGQWIVTLNEESEWGIQDDSRSSSLSELTMSLREMVKSALPKDEFGLSPCCQRAIQMGMLNKQLKNRNFCLQKTGTEEIDQESSTQES